MDSNFTSYTYEPLPGTTTIWTTQTDSPTKAQIVQRLLENGTITAEEAVTLLSNGHAYQVPANDPYAPPFRVTSTSTNPAETD